MSRLSLMALAALASFPTAAFCADAPPTATVQLAQVDFRKGPDVDRLYAQLKRSAEAVCDSNSSNPRITQADQICAERALAKAVHAVNRPTLTARYERAVGPARAMAAQDY